jgi:hypothetical protein
MNDEDLARLARPLLWEDPDDPSARPIKLYRLRDVTVRGGPAGSLLLLHPHACFKLASFCRKAQGERLAWRRLREPPCLLSLPAIKMSFRPPASPSAHRLQHFAPKTLPQRCATI